MKNLYKPFIAVLLISLFVAGCKKDKTESQKNSFKYDNTEHTLTKGFLENYGKSGIQGYNIDLTLLSSSLAIHESSGAVDSITGTGDGLLIELFTSLPDKLDVKDYIYDATKSGADGTFDDGVVFISFNPSTLIGTFYEITGGKVSVTGNGSEYEITINCTASNGKTITGYYKGNLKYYNYGKKKKSEYRFPTK